MESYFRQATVNLNEILKHPGVWDPFILSYVEVGAHIFTLGNVYVVSQSGGVYSNCIAVFIVEHSLVIHQLMLTEFVFIEYFSSKLLN